ncbi:hypothetical protein [Archangium violaceum]|uniref:DUF4340 domain-containing protein n=1 Tax=Archangium violaceum Cb vi76 TaxID=1406225 RepID=A0A084SW24_9BACT|nr:hypothetical protein [Archangium violaceum]KFA92659.1 hypothetical protein Q664_13710 [Archangium violaceum Cb vi76]
MRARGVVLQGVLAAAGLAAAFFVWQREPVGAPGEVVVLDAPERALERVRYEDASVQVELFREGPGDGALWLRLGAKRELRANETAEQLFTRFAPLRATRSLGVLEAEKLAEVGLKDSPRKLVVKLASGEHAFTLAAPAIGWGSPYLRRETDGHVFLLSPSLLPDLENAAHRLVDRTLHAFGASDYDTLTVTVGSTSRTFLVRARERRPAELLPRDAPDTPDETARKWHERVWLLAPAQADFLGRGEVPPGGEPREAFRVEYQRGAQRIGQLTVGRGAGGGFHARTEYTAGWAKLPPWADSIVLEAEKVAAGH